MRILIAPDKFKGTLSAREVGEAIAAGLRAVLPDATIDIIPMADGGEGTAEVIGQALGASWIKCKAHDPRGREIEARYGWVEKDKLAVMEMSEAAGMRRLTPNELNPEVATTFGVGEMIRDAAKCGANEIIIGLGGSATNDGGLGMARALGFRFLGSDGREINNVLDLISLQRIAGEDKSEDKGNVKITAAVDVKNPLLGENGATRVFGPQKGVPAEKLEKFERALTRLAEVAKDQFGYDHQNEPGSGAAGGLGFGLLSFCGAKIRPGFEVVAEAVGLGRKMQDVDVVITGEGRLDRQTLEGKTPAGVAQLARRFKKPVFAFVGRAIDDRQVRALFEGVYTNARPGMSDEENRKRAAEFLQDNARQLAEDLNKSARE